MNLLFLLGLYYLSRREQGGSSSGPRPVPVLTQGEHHLWMVRDHGGGLFEVTTDVDAPVCSFVDAGGVRSLKSHPSGVSQKLLDAAILDFKLRTPPAKAA